MIAAHPNAPLPGDGDPQMLILAGGIPIRAGSEVIGGIGVGGSPSQGDAMCAQAGIDRIGSQEIFEQTRTAMRRVHPGHTGECSPSLCTTAHIQR